MSAMDRIYYGREKIAHEFVFTDPIEEGTYVIDRIDNISKKVYVSKDIDNSRDSSISVSSLRSFFNRNH